MNSHKDIGDLLVWASEEKLHGSCKGWWHSTISNNQTTHVGENATDALRVEPQTTGTTVIVVGADNIFCCPGCPMRGQRLYGGWSDIGCAGQNRPVVLHSPSSPHTYLAEFLYRISFLTQPGTQSPLVAGGGAATVKMIKSKDCSTMTDGHLETCLSTSSYSPDDGTLADSIQFTSSE